MFTLESHLVAAHNTYLPEPDRQQFVAATCYELDSNSAVSTGIVTVTAGSTVGFKASRVIGHSGVQGLGMVAYLISEQCLYHAFREYVVIIPFTPLYDHDDLAIGRQSVYYHYPKEHAKQPTLGSICSEIRKGINHAMRKGNPTPTVSFPGAYVANDPGILLSKLEVYRQIPPRNDLHGGTSGTPSTLTLNSGERATQVQACSGTFNDSTRVFFLSLLTNQGRTLQAGKTTSDCSTAVVPTDVGAGGAQWGLVAFWGRQGMK
ncbi:hypothetical protein Hypma_014306 [Hypsizygus marmoreus]|uniref:Jacalin-type lectin domain-containing protein n=1 Tax=Hypsizygus marmoreus TaxID=39966 RepID=A0A369JH24_HYPMA|nr:hypothetical protein Hypma_014306 [Hypsizygus marmoreus]